MKKIAGSLKLELAQYREIAAFAQFGSDLDEDTRLILERGSVLVEMLKQDQYSPMDVSSQVVVIYATSLGLFASMPVSEIKSKEQSILDFKDSCILFTPFFEELPEMKDFQKEDLDLFFKIYQLS